MMTYNMVTRGLRVSLQIQSYEHAHYTHWVAPDTFDIVLMLEKILM